MYDRTRGDVFKMKEGTRYKVDIFYNKDGQTLPQVMDVSSLEIFMVRLDRALNILIYLKMSLLTAGGLQL